MPQKYILEIYEPRSADEVHCTFESDRPFQAIHKGELLNPDGRHSQYILRVVQVQHLFWSIGGPGEGLSHKVCIYTDEARNAHETFTSEG